MSAIYIELFKLLTKRKKSFIISPQLNEYTSQIGVSPSGKAAGFGPAIRGFESSHPSHNPSNNAG